MSAAKVVVAGALAAKEGNGGEAWVRLSWVRALAELGFDVRFVEELAQPTAEQRRWFTSVADAFGLADRALLVTSAGSKVAADWLADSALAVNISGNLREPALLAAARCCVYVDLDPGYTQIWHQQGLLGDQLHRHHHHVTVGLNVGRRACGLPTGGFRWIGVVPPVVLADWPLGSAVAGASNPRFTTVAAFRGAFGRLCHGEQTYGQKAHELRRFADLPSAGLPWPAEIALAIDPADHADAERLTAGGWWLADPGAAAGNPDRFRRYVQQSAAELSVAQGVYVETASGWISDRSVRYLASGRPVLVQDTGLGFGPGLGGDLPLGEGFCTFRNAPEAVATAQRLAEGYDRHSRAARLWAETYATPGAALRPLLEAAGVAP